VSDDPAVRERAHAMIEAALQRAAWLGCAALLYVPGLVGCPFAPDQKVRYDVAVQRCRENVERLLAYRRAGPRGPVPRERLERYVPLAARAA
jgi:L-ribulose-5-phosphate 3-epimerase